MTKQARISFYQQTRRTSKRNTPMLRQRASDIIRSLRKSFTRPLWMDESHVPELIRAMARQVGTFSHLLAPSRLDYNN